MIALTCSDRSPACRTRTGIGASMQKKFLCRGFSVSRNGGKCLFSDRVTESLCRAGRIRAEDYEAYRAEASASLLESPLLTEGTDEALFRLLHGMRLRTFGAEVYRSLWKTASPAQEVRGIDQSALTEPLWQKGAVVFCVTDPAYLGDFLRDVRRAQNRRMEIFVLTEEPGSILPDQALLSPLTGPGVTFIPAGKGGVTELSGVSVPEDAFFCGYGEDAFTACRRLTVPAAVTVLPESMPVRAAVGLFTEPAVCRLYIPAGFDIFPHVPLGERTELTFYQLAALAEKYGESVYFRTVPEMIRLEPTLFFNFYDDHLPPVIRNDFRYTGGSWLSAREAYISDLLSRAPGIRYLHTCLRKDTFEPVPVNWETAEKQNQLLVDGVLASPERTLTVYPGGDGAVSPRKFFFRSTEKRTAILSNFAFFFTDKLRLAYNLLRADRPREQLTEPCGYVDYFRCTDERGVRHETFPLYRKTCMAMRRSGGFAAFSWQLGGGSVTLPNGCVFRWEAENVNVPGGDTVMFTPMLAQDFPDEDPKTFRLPVGEGRLNVLLIGESVRCIRDGDVLLPCVGVVLSLAGKAAEKLRKALPAPDGNGYYPASGTAKIRLDPPEGWTQTEWDDLAWVYGGGLGLLSPGSELTAENLADTLRPSGWLSPLSRQTQESSLHTLSVHPRTAVGVTAGGELCILVFSGRTKVSAGADYTEVCRAAKLLVPGLETLINWDGGGSSFLGLLQDNVFTELSCTAPSDDSVPGMVRPVSSMLALNLEGAIL